MPLANAVKNGTPTKGYVNDHSLTSLVGWQTVSLCFEVGKEDKEVCSDVD